MFKISYMQNTQNILIRNEITYICFIVDFQVNREVYFQCQNIFHVQKLTVVW